MRRCTSMSSWYRYRTAIVPLLTCLIVFSQPLRAEWYKQQRPYMGTEVTVELWHPKQEVATVLIEEVFAEIERLDLMMNPWNPESELARINREAGPRSVSTTDEIVEVVQRALYYSTLSEGAFDISFAGAGQHYDFREGIAPDDEVLKRASEDIDYRAIRLTVPTRQIRFDKPGMQIDLGGIAKGYAVDRAIDILRRERIQSAVIAAGGDTRIIGDLGDRARTIGIRHPRKPDDYSVLIPLEDTAISTSGDYERYFEKGGVRYHHILDPTTGKSAGLVQSASVLAPSAMESDALSTTVFVLGVERGLSLINQLGGVDAIIIDGSGRLHYSDDLLRSE